MPAVLVAVAGAILLVLVLALPRVRSWQFLSLFSSVSPVPVQLSLNASFMMALATLLRDPVGKLKLVRGFIPSALLVMALTQFASALWSARASAALTVGATTLAILALILFVMQQPAAGSASRDLLHAAAVAMVPVAVAQSVSTVVFRFDPDLEHRYFTSPLIVWLLGDEGRLLFSTLRNNVVDPLKSGGFLFVNGNKASMVMAVWALMYLSLCIKRRSFFHFAMFAVCMTGAISTSSKTAIFLAFSLVPFFLFLPLIVRVRANPAGFIGGLVVLIGASFGLAYVISTLSERLVGIDESADDRARLWAGALTYFGESPLLGLGVGGWAQRWGSDPAATGLETLPPHNMLIMLWADSGLLTPLIAVAIFLVIAVRYLKKIAASERHRDATAAALELAAMVWIFAHGMYDNTNFYGDVHTMVVFAVICARAATGMVGEVQSHADGVGAHVLVPDSSPRGPKGRGRGDARRRRPATNTRTSQGTRGDQNGG